MLQAIEQYSDNWREELIQAICSLFECVSEEEVECLYELEVEDLTDIWFNTLESDKPLEELFDANNREYKVFFAVADKQKPDYYDFGSAFLNALGKSEYTSFDVDMSELNESLYVDNIVLGFMLAQGGYFESVYLNWLSFCNVNVYALDKSYIYG